MKRNRKNLRRISVLVTAQTLEKLALMAGYGHELGRMVDKLTRDRMVSLRYKEDDRCI